MNDLSHYAALINRIFGERSATFKTSSLSTNNVIGALNFAGNYTAFKSNFIARLQRLKEIYNVHPAQLREIIVQVNEVANPKNWEGAFAELAALDYFNQEILRHRMYLREPVSLNVSLPPTRTFGSQLGKKEANLDGCIDDFRLYFDIKVFKDNVKDILKGIYEEVYAHFKITGGLVIETDHALDISYDDLKKKRKNLAAELKATIDLKKRTKGFRSKVIPELTCRLHWGKGILMTEKTYNPYRHAENYHKTVFNYANKFLKESPTLIVMVSFAWYNNTISNFSNSNVKLYRSLSRRVFCQYRHQRILFNTFSTSFKGTETIHEVSQYLSGIVFLEDETIMSGNPEHTNVKSYLYLNPNAKHNLAQSIAREYLGSLRHSAYDDFSYDNY